MTTEISHSSAALDPSLKWQPNVLDINHFINGELYHSYSLFGAQLLNINGISGTRFTVWAPGAKSVSVVGDFNYWQRHEHPMKLVEEGIWSTFIPYLTEGTLYKYELETPEGVFFMKTDPFAFQAELRPATASIVYDLEGYEWKDQLWCKRREKEKSYEKPMLIYEVHLGSWKKKNGELLSYAELASEIVEYVLEMGYTHLELLPIVEHPYDRSWGYQGTGYYGVTSRFGNPQEFMYFVDYCHQHHIGVILDWVPGHFCKDAHGLYRFDGTTLYEYANDEQANNLEWGTANFDLGKREVRNFLISNAIFWLDKYHIDGIRVDAVSHMLFQQEKTSPTPNEAAISFLKQLNEAVFASYPYALMMAEDSSAWPLVTSPTYLGGLGFNYKWNMGWMNDVLKYMQLDPIYRKWNHHLLTFAMMYAYSENFVLALSHDEVVHGKKSLLNKMYGPYEEKFAQLRLLLGFMLTHPGKKLLFMGNDIAQYDEWKDLEQVDWSITKFENHSNFKKYMKRLFHIYIEEKALWELDFDPEGFEWIDADNADQSIISFIRKSKDDHLVIICNFTPQAYSHYKIGVPIQCRYKEVFSNQDNHILELDEGDDKGIQYVSRKETWHSKPFHITIEITPYMFKIFRPMVQEDIFTNVLNKREEKDNEG